MRPSLTDPLAFITMAGPYGSQPNSSSRIPLQPHRSPGRAAARHQRGVERHVVGAVVAVAARAFRVDATNLLRLHAERRPPDCRGWETRPASGSITVILAVLEFGPAAQDGPIEPCAI